MNVLIKLFYSILSGTIYGFLYILGPEDTFTFEDLTLNLLTPRVGKFPYICLDVPLEDEYYCIVLRNVL